MGGYSEKCPWCDKWFIKPGISDHVQGKHPALFETFRSMRRSYPNRLINQPIPATGVVAQQGDEMAKGSKVVEKGEGQVPLDIEQNAVDAAFAAEPDRVFSTDEVEGIKANARAENAKKIDDEDNEKREAFMIPVEDAFTSLLQVLYDRKVISWPNVKQITGA